jgi:hypothetical protein
MWQGRMPLIGLNSEPSGYAMYTYVLLGQERPDPAVRQKYQQILLAVQSNTHGFSELAEAGASPHETNLFCIPSKQTNSGTAPLSDYNWDLALQLLVRTNRAIQKEHNSSTAEKLATNLASEPGPFLVSTRVPIGNVKGEAVLLVADLSKSNSHAIAATVAAYEKSITSPPEGAQLFSPFSLILLNVLLDASDYARVVEAKI